MVAKEDILQMLTLFSVAYKTEYNENEVNLYYDFLKDYDKKVISIATKEIIKTSPFLPKIADILKKCDEVKETQKFEILEFMKYKSYFKCDEEYQKANKWLRDKIIPDWFLKDLREYQELSKQQQLQSNETLLIE